MTSTSRTGLRWLLIVLLIALGGLAGGRSAGLVSIPWKRWPFTIDKPQAAAVTSPKLPEGAFKPTEAQWRTLTVEQVAVMPFRSALTTDGKIAIDEDHTTPMFSPYTGRILRQFARPGDLVEKGKPLFTIEATDMVQGQNDFIAAKANVNKARSQLSVAAIVLKRHRDLYQVSAVAKRDLEQAEVTHVAASNDLKSGEVALESARNRLRILGKTDAEISNFENGRAQISAETTILAPLSGTILQRKVGPGQYVTSASSDPVFVIGDLSKVWLIGNVRESDAAKIKIGQKIEFTILAAPEQVFTSEISYISASVNPDTHRLQVRAEIGNAERQLRPEMFANVSIITSGSGQELGIPRHSVIYEGEAAHVWVVREDRSIEMRTIQPGIVSGGHVQVQAGLKPSEKIITRGSLFIDRLAAPAMVEHD